jgi:hypothetical protein
MKKRYLIALSAVAFFISFVFSGVAFAQGKEGARVIEETLVVKDPTVSVPGKWVIGGALEYWYSSGSYNKYDFAGNKTAEGTIEGGMPGGNIFVGYGNFSLNYAYRKGSWDIDLQYLSPSVKTVETQDQTENELTLRYLIRASKYVNPYILAGYTQIDLSSTETIKTPGWVWTYNGKTAKKYDTTFRAPLLGLGFIFPLHERFGIRIDGRAHYSDAEKKWDNGTKYTGNGWGYSGTATAYVNIFKGINLQVGGKYLKLDGGTDIGWWDKWGLFGMLGYSYKF